MREEFLEVQLHSHYRAYLVVVSVVAVLVGGLVLHQVLVGGPEVPSKAHRQLAVQRSLALPHIGSLAPDFTLPDLDGTSVTLSQYRGQAVLVNLWALWCAPCVEEMPSLQEMYDLRGEDLVVLAVDVGRSEPQEVRSFAAEHGLRFPVLLDTEGLVKELYGVSRVPETFLVSREGTLAGKFIGPRNWASESTLAHVQGLLDEHK